MTIITQHKLTETGDGTWKHVIMPMHLGRR